MQASLLVAWLVTAMMAFTSGRTDPTREVRLDFAARELLTIAYEKAETPIYPGEYGRARSALLVASIAAAESGYDSRIAAGDCRKGECDGGRAFCWMQIHPEGSIALKGDGWTYLAQVPSFDRASYDSYAGADLLGDPSGCFRVGMHMARASMRSTNSLRYYTGEWTGSAPKASFRKALAENFFKRHPPPVTDDEVADEHPVAMR